MELEPLDFDPFPTTAATAAPKPAPTLEPIDFDPFPVAASQPEPQGWYESTAQTARDSISKSAVGRGFTAGLLQENPDNLGNAVEGFGHLAGSTWAIDQGKAIQDWAKTAGGVSKQGAGVLDSDSLDSFLTNVGETFGSGVASTVPSVVAGLGGAAVGSVAGPVGAIGGGVVGAGSASYVQSFGELYGALKEAGVDPQRAAELSKYGAVPIASLDMIGLGGMAKPFIGEARREIVHGLARRIATEAAKGATTEGITEAAQEFLKDATVTYETGRPLFTAERAKGWAEAGIGGALVGGAVDAGAGFRRPAAARDPNAPDPNLPPPKPGDIESPIPTADIQRGRAMMDALIEGRMEEAMGLGRPGQAPAPAAPGPAPSAPMPQPAAPRGYEPLYDDEDPELQVGWINPRTGDVRGLNRGASNEGTAAAPEPVSAAEAAPPLERPAPGDQAAPVSEGLKTNSSSPAAQDAETSRRLRLQNEINQAFLGDSEIPPSDEAQAIIDRMPADLKAFAFRMGEHARGMIDAEKVLDPETVDEIKKNFAASVDPGLLKKFQAYVDAAMRDTRRIGVTGAATGGMVAPITAPASPPSGDGSRAAPVKVEHPDHVEVAAARAQTAPSDGQKEAGNYQKGHLRLGGMDITIETPKDAERSGTAPDGTRWSVKMPAHYGYVKRSEGADGDQVDVYIGPEADTGRVFVFDQFDPKTRRFDEHKAVLGVRSIEDAQDLYDGGFSDGSGPRRRGGVTEMSTDEFRTWAMSGDTSKPLGEDLAAAPVAAPAATPETMDRVTGFRTAKGSTYTIDESGRTVRDKAARNDPGHEGDSGVKPVTARTVYLDVDASQLSAAGLTLNVPEKGARVAFRADGKAALLTWNPKANQWGKSSSWLDVRNEPAVGRYPLELWKPVDDVPGHEAYGRMHAGNKIVEIFSRNRQDGVVPAATPEPAPKKPKTWDETLPTAPPAADEPPLAPNAFRLYRGEGGTMMGSEAGGRWFTTSRSKAEKYAEGGGRVVYVDIDKADRRSLMGLGQGAGGADEVLTDVPYILKAVKPLGKASPAPVNTTPKPQKPATDRVSEGPAVTTSAPAETKIERAKRRAREMVAEGKTTGDIQRTLRAEGASNVEVTAATREAGKAQAKTPETTPEIAPKSENPSAMPAPKPAMPPIEDARERQRQENIRALDERAMIPDGFELGAVRKLDKFDVSGTTRTVGDFKAVVRRVAPFGTFDGYGQTREEAIKDALRQAQAFRSTNETAQEPPRRAIGENRFGQPVFEDERGVRSYVADGIRMTESVATAPDGSTSVRKDARSESFKTRAESEAEIEQRRAARNTNVEGLVRSMAGDGKTWAEVLSALKETGPLSDEDLRRAARAFREMLEKAGRLPSEARSEAVDSKPAKPEPLQGYSDKHPDWATSHEQDVGGKIVYSDDDMALLEGFSQINGRPVFLGVDRKTRQRTRVDIEGYTGPVFSAERKAALVEAKARQVAADEAAHAARPDGPFRGGAKVAASDSVPEAIVSIARDWLKMLGIEARVFITTLPDANSVAQADKHGLYGPFAAVRSAGVDKMENGSTRRLANGDHYIALDLSGRRSAQLETLAHEIGHILEKEVWKTADPSTKQSVVDAYKEWLQGRSTASPAEWVRSLRAHTVGKLTPIRADATSTASDLPPYWSSFNEWFADQVSRWATSSEAPVSVVDRFFSRIARGLRRLYASAAGKKLLPTSAMKTWLDGRAKENTAPLEAMPIQTEPETAQPPAQEPKKPATYGTENKVFTADAAEKARAVLRAKLKGQINSGLDPEIVQAGITLAGFHIEAGARKFADYSRAMIADLGEEVRPYLRSWYEGVRYYPGFDAHGMSTATEIEAESADGTDTAIRAPEESVQPEAGAVPAGRAPEGAPETEGERAAEGAPRSDRRGSRRGARDVRAAAPDQPERPEGDGGAAGLLPADSADRGGDRPERRRVRAAKPVAEKAVEEVSNSRADRARKNYRITEDDRIGQGGPKEKVRANIEAIRTLKRIEDEKRQATAEEKRALVKFVGWGAFAQPIFDSRPRTEWKDERAAVFDLLTPEEIAAARKSTLNAHYTSEPVIRGMWDALAHLGFKGGRALEPSSGVGHFIGLTPDAARDNTAWTAVELDTTTGRIAQLLYDGSDVNVQGFEDFKRPDDFFDLAISNVPFGDFTIRDTKRPGLLIHDYFFVKGLDLVRPGGLVAFITSSGTMDKLDKKARRMILDRADFLGAIRLPGGDRGAFAGNAGTEVTTDIIFLRKRAAGQEPRHAGEFLETKRIDTPEGPTSVNAYFAANSDMMLGEMRLVGSMYRANSPVLVGDATDLDKRIAKAARKMEAGAMLPRQMPPRVEKQAEIDLAAGEIKEGAIYQKGGKAFRKVNGVGQEMKLSTANAQKLPGFLAMRDAVNKLLAKQARGDRTGLDAIRKDLNKAYDAFVKAHGPINRVVETVQTRTDKKTGATSTVTIRRLPNFTPFADDPDAYKTAAIEEYDEVSDTGRKAAIFTTDIVGAYEPPEVTGPTDAIAVSLNERGKVDIGLIAERMNLSEAETIRTLGDLVYEDPIAGDWRTANDYLSGDVVTALEQARAGAKSDPDKFERNVVALEKVQPTPLSRVDVRVNFGAPWVPVDVYEDFLRSIGGRQISVRMNPVTKTVQVTEGSFDSSAQGAYGTNRAGAKDVVNAALKQTSFKIYDKDADGNAVVNEPATQEVLVKIASLREAFAGNPEAGIDGWVWQDDGRAERLEALYNASFNRMVPVVYDGSHLALPGLAKSITNGNGETIPFGLRPHQKDAVWRVIQSGNTLLDHVVGAGKTFTMIAAGMEQKRLGLIQRPMYVVPNHMLEQFSREFYQAYPNAKLLVATKDQMTKDRRKEFAARVAADRWDGIIITHDAFGRIAMSAEASARYLRDEIARLQTAIDGAREEEGKKSRTVKEIEKAQENIEARLEKLMNTERKDEGVTFEELGIDFLVVDEAHLFKNLRIATRHTRVKGIGKSASQRAEDLFIKIRTLEQSRPGRSTLFATGTPISNTMAEMYVMQRYLQNDTLVEYGVDEFDAWAATFGEITTQMELAPNGRTFQETTSFAKFVNIPELVALYSKVADVKTAEMLNLPRPTLKGGAIKVVEAEPSNAEEQYIADLVERAAAMKGKRVEKGGDNMLKIVSEGRKVATDFRLLRPDAEINPDGKIAKAVDNLYRIWKDGKDPALAQIVFLDMGVPSSKGGTDLAAKNWNELAMPLRALWAREAHGLDEAAGEFDRKAPFNKQPDRVQRLWRANQSAPTMKSRMEGDIDEAEDGADVESSVLYETKFNLYEDIRERLVARGIPKEQVAFIHEATDDVKKGALFRKVRSGEVRILIGSTGKMGVGTNVQRKLVAMHHLDAPWKPAEVEQRDGRIIRQGNENREVDMFRYITKRSFDSFMWQALERKSKFIAQIKAGARGIRSAEDIDDPLPEAAALKAAASGDVRVIEHAELTKEIRDLENQKRNHDRNIQRAKAGLATAREQLSIMEGNKAALDADAAAVVDIAGDKFKVDLAFNSQGTMTDRRAAGEATRSFLVNSARSIYSQVPVQWSLGTIGGLRMRASARRIGEGVAITPFVEGKGTYSSREFLLTEEADPIALIGRWERIVRDVPGMAAEMPERVTAKRDEVARLTSQAKDVAFPKDERLAAAKRRLIDLEAALKPKDPAKAVDAAAPTQMGGPNQFSEASPAGWGEVETMPQPRLSEAEVAEIAEIIQRVAGLDGVRVADTIPIPANSPGAKAWGRTEAGRASAFYSGVSDTVTIALDMPEGAGRRVAYHEAFHRLQRLYLTTKEQAVLLAEGDRLRAIIAASMGRGRAVADRMAQSEVGAEAFSLYTVAKERADGSITSFPLRARAVFAKIDRIVRAVRNWLNGRGFQTYEDVFDRAAEGRTALRTARGITGTTVMDDFSMIDDTDTEEDSDLDFGAPRRSMGQALFARNATLLQRVRGATNWDAVSETMDRWRYAVQDIVIDLKQVQREIVEILGPLAESQNPYLAYELSESRAGPRLEALHEDMVSPMLARMKAAGISIEELDEYLYAKHAPERNARIAEINPKIPEGGSGMTDEEAASIVDRVESGPNARDYARLASLVYEINDFALQTRLEAGLLSEEQADAWRQSYEFYVPLRGFAEMDPDSFEDRPSLGGSGVNVRGKESQRALGRESRAADIVAHAIMQAQEAIARAERNKVGQALYELARAAPNREFWRADPVKTKAVWNKKLQQVVYQRVHALSRTEEDHTVFLKIDGQEHRVSFNMQNPRARRLAEGMRRLKGKDWGALVRTFGAVNRFLSTVNTTLSPEFIITNAFKDLQTAMVNIGQYDVEGIRKRTLKHWASVWKGLARLKSPQQRDEWRPWYEEFIAEGGRTYWNDVESVQEIAHRLEAEINPSTGLGARSRRGVKSVFNVIEAANNNVENAIRLAAFRAAREAGMSPAAAASLAKNLTVNFNRRGAYGPLINAFYLFFNAGIQGSFAILGAMRSPAVRKAVGAIIVSGAIVTLFNSLAGDDDEDGESFYNKIPDEVRQKNMIIMIPGTGGRYAKIAMPWGYNAFYSLGRVSMEAAFGRKPLDAAADAMVGFLDAFNPIGGAQNLLKIVSPTIIDPIVELYANRDFADRPIAPDKKTFGAEVPNAQRYWNSVSPFWRGVTDFLTAASGGDKIRPGKIDVSPEWLEYLYGIATGSAGQFVSRTAGLVMKIGDPASDWSVNDVPFARRVLGGKAGWVDKAAFYERLHDVEQQKAYLKGYVGAGDIEGRDAVIAESRDKLGLEKAAHASQKAIADIRRARDAAWKAKDRGAMDDAEYRERVTALKEREREIVMRFNRAWFKRVENPSSSDEP